MARSSQRSIIEDDPIATEGETNRSQMTSHVSERISRSDACRSVGRDCAGIDRCCCARHVAGLYSANGSVTARGQRAWFVSPQTKRPGSPKGWLLEKIKDMLKRFTNAAVIVCALLLAASAALPAPQEAKEKVPKDMAEYELINKTFAEADPATKLQLLAEWTEKYPETDYMEDRLRIPMRANQQLGKFAEAISSANEILSQFPGDFEANLTIATLTPALGGDSAEVLAAGEKAASSLIAAGKPANLTDEQWNSVKGQVMTTSHQTLGWVHMQRKDNVKAEAEFKTLLGMNPNLGQISYWLGNVVLSQGDPDKNELALFSFARACVNEGEGALAPEGRKQVCDYLSTVYGKYAGTQDGLDGLKQAAAKQPLPPAGLAIESASVREFKAEEARRKANPLVYKFIDLRDALTGSNGDNIWSNLQGKISPRMTLYVLGSDSDRPQVVNLGSKPDGPVEVGLNLENRLRAAPGRGSKLTFEGVASNMTKEPFKLTLTAGNTF
jgi:tetratricopeptide (TPR) repeat protein